MIKHVWCRWVQQTYLGEWEHVACYFSGTTAPNIPGGYFVIGHVELRGSLWLLKHVWDGSLGFQHSHFQRLLTIVFMQTMKAKRFIRIDLILVFNGSRMFRKRSTYRKHLINHFPMDKDELNYFWICYKHLTTYLLYFMSTAFEPPVSENIK